MRKITLVEAKLTLRDPVGLFFTIALPTLLLVVLGLSIPDLRAPQADLGGERVVDSHFPAMMIVLTVGTAAFSVLPSYLAAYREQGVLRRLSTTPVGPGRLLAAQVLVNVVVMLAGVLVMTVAGGLVLDVPAPAGIAAFLGVLVLGMVTMLALGLLVAGFARTAKTAQGLGSLLLFPMLFLAGMWVPRQLMPEGLRVASDLSPVGPFGQALRDTWAGAAPDPAHLAVMAVWALAAGALAARTFRWE